MDQNRLMGTNTNLNSHYYIPFLKEPQPQETTVKKKKEKR